VRLAPVEVFEAVPLHQLLRYLPGGVAAGTAGGRGWAAAAAFFSVAALSLAFA
jgi:hypothetical protein